MATTRTAGQGLLITDEGGLYILNVLFNGTAVPTSLYLRLIGHATVPIASLTDTDVDTTFFSVYDGASECATVIDALENAVSLNASLIPEAAWDVQSFTFNGPVTANNVSNATIYGYQVIVNSGTYPVLFEELFATPFKPTTAGDVLRLIPKLLIGNGTPA